MPRTRALGLEALAEVVEADAVDRRQFLVRVGVTLTSAAHEWLFDPARAAASLHGKCVGHKLIDDLDHVVETKRHRDDAIGGGTLLPSVWEDLRLVVSMLRNAAYPEDVGRRLHGVAAEMGRLAGWLAYDSDQHSFAQRFWLAALRAAHVSGERATGANVLGFMSVSAALSERPLDAVLLAESALGRERHLTPAVAALIHSRFASARVVDERAGRRAQERAESVLACSVVSDEPAWVYWFTEAELEGVTGTALLEFGQPAATEAHLRRAVALIDPAFARDRAMWMSDLASARVGAGSWEYTCSTVSEAAAIMRRLESPWDQRILARFRAATAPYEGSAAVREFDAEYHDLVALPWRSPTCERWNLVRAKVSERSARVGLGAVPAQQLRLHPAECQRTAVRTVRPPVLAAVAHRARCTQSAHIIPILPRAADRCRCCDRRAAPPVVQTGLDDPREQGRRRRPLQRLPLGNRPGRRQRHRRLSR